ncbi:CotJB protein [Anaerotignum neopropionicum]|uniref:CotJB protein n=1 Tax=Anaerotignum neopropionicum TaxID=36847 RepID=A0A136WBP2_9FIRM|nr:spore coat protein CotJB [Anaerotignum neopropionicum]KXL51918.1 CotJB protein [Anaerotignum neopropionicum]
MTQDNMLTKLMELDFISLDLGLFLNTHPDNAEAIDSYNQVITAADALRLKFEDAYGPLCSFRSYAADTSQWQWKDNPWPWQKIANVTLAGKECL